MTHTGISTRYAKAFVDALASSPATDAPASLDALRGFVELLGQSHDLELVLLSPSVSSQRKRAVIAKIADALGLDRMVRNLLFVLIDHRRLPLLREISSLSFLMLDERTGFVRARVSSAAPLSGDEERDISGRLANLTGKRTRMELSVDPDLIGGVVARVGSTVYDGSVRGRLRSIGQRLAAD